MRSRGGHRARLNIDIDTPARLVDRHCPERNVVLATDDPTAEERFRAIPRVESVVRSDLQRHDI